MPNGISAGSLAADVTGYYDEVYYSPSEGALVETTTGLDANGNLQYTTMTYTPDGNMAGPTYAASAPDSTGSRVYERRWIIEQDQPVTGVRRGYGVSKFAEPSHSIGRFISNEHGEAMIINPIAITVCPAQRSKHAAGFTLIEFMVAMAMFLVLGGAVFQMFAKQAPAFSRQQNLAGTSIALQNAVSQMQIDLANAGTGYYPGDLSSQALQLEPQSSTSLRGRAPATSRLLLRIQRHASIP